MDREEHGEKNPMARPVTEEEVKRWQLGVVEAHEDWQRVIAKNAAATHDCFGVKK